MARSSRNQMLPLNRRHRISKCRIRIYKVLGLPCSLIRRSTCLIPTLPLRFDFFIKTSLFLVWPAYDLPFFFSHISRLTWLVVSDDRVSEALFLCSAGHRIKTTLFASDCAFVGLDEIARASSPLVATRTVSAREFRSLVLRGNAEIEALFCVRSKPLPNQLDFHGIG